MLKIENVLNNYLSLPKDANEENIKIHIVLEILEFLGYKKGSFEFEYSSISGRCDILIKITNTDRLIVETKRKNYSITEDDCIQLCTYLTTQNIEWGILTNGNEYFLINSYIKGTPKQKICLYCQLLYEQSTNMWNLSKKYNYLLLDYLSLDNIFKKHSTKYFTYYSSYINNYDETRTLQSIKQYSSSIFRFINYISKNYNYCDEGLLSMSTLTQYMNDYCKNKSYKKDTIINSCRYLISFLKYLELNSILQTKYFVNFNYNEFLSILEFNDTCSKSDSISIEEAQLLLNYFDNSPRNFAGLRNKIILNLLLYVAPSIDSILNINTGDIDFKRGFIKINNINVPLNPKLKDDLFIYLKERNKLKPKINNLFFTKYRNKFNTLSSFTIINNINESFNQINSLTDSRKKDLNISNIQRSVIENMLKNDFSLEEISIITGKNISSLSKYLTDDILKKRLKNINKSLNSKKHPYYELFIWTQHRFGIEFNLKSRVEFSNQASQWSLVVYRFTYHR